LDDPISPYLFIYLFILCIERFEHRIQEGVAM